MPEYGCWLDLPSPQVAEIIAQVGFDFIVVDELVIADHKQ